MPTSRGPLDVYRRLVKVGTALLVGACVSVAVLPFPIGICVLLFVAFVLLLVAWSAMLFLPCPRCKEPIASALFAWAFTPAAWARHLPPADLRCPRCGASLGSESDSHDH